jgi:6-phosphofructokinase 1
MKKIAVLTSGGSAPGMNAAIRAVVRSGIARGLTVMGVQRGYAGLLAGDLREMDVTSVSGIINRGGTILHTSRCQEFHEPAGRRQAAEVLAAQGLEGLIVIGGSGSSQGAWRLFAETDFPILVVPSTIDNDVGGCDYSIGFDTAVDTAVGCIDKIRDTADSHERIFVIEVMGRDAGFLGLETALAGGAEAALLPEFPWNLDDLCARIAAWEQRGKRSFIIVVAEGAGSALEISAQIAERTGSETRATTLGHLQRGGIPTVDDRILASRTGAAAVAALLDGARGQTVGVIGREVVVTSLEEVCRTRKRPDPQLYELVNALSG